MNAAAQTFLTNLHSGAAVAPAGKGIVIECLKQKWAKIELVGFHASKVTITNKGVAALGQARNKGN
jgi:hypothetical protein